MSTIRLLGAFVGLIVFACGAAWSQPYPSKPVRVVVVFPPGGATDIVARFVFQKMSEQMNQQFVIDNRGGAAGMIGAEIVAKSLPDGYTLMVYSQTLLANAHLYQKLPYDPLKDFIGITRLARLVGMLGVHPSMPVRTTKDFIALAKARPGEILYGSAGIGAFQHLSMSVFANMIGVKMTHVPFKGGAPAVVATDGRRDTCDTHTDSRTLPLPQVGSRAAHRGVFGYANHPVSGDPRHRGNREGFRIHLVVWCFCAGRHTEADHRQAQRRDQESGGRSRCRLEAFGPGARSHAYDPRGFR